MPIINSKIPLPQESNQHPNKQPDVYKVSDLNRQAKRLLENRFSAIQVEGEISTLAKPASGHLYFTLKDERAQIKCAFFKNKARFLNFDLKDGAQVIATADLSLYEARGDYQLIISSLELAGAGNLALRFEQLKMKLQQEGLFEPSIKKMLPKLPRRIGIITSGTGAALHDILTTLKRRFPAIPLCLYPTQVQGEEAAPKIAKQIQLANQQSYCDVIILARGGGSLEDLWAFNEEIVAYAIYKSQIPIVTGIGHEVDVTLADYCADLRAATPTAAAETITPHQDDVRAYLADKQQQLLKLIRNRLNGYQQHYQFLLKRLRSPASLINQKWLHIDALQKKLELAFQRQLQCKRQRVELLQKRLLHHNPQQNINAKKIQLEQLKPRLEQAIDKLLQTKITQFQKLCTTLHATSPLATLDRGYALAQDENKQIITQATQLQLDDTLWVTLKSGKLHCRLIGKKNDE